MGMSASQARLLSITARLTNNEFRAQTITNSKLRLATESAQANKIYMEALDSQELMFMNYDENGEASKLALTHSLMYQYAPLKNQYILRNPNGKILVNNIDAKNFANTANLHEFLDRYGLLEDLEYGQRIKYVENPKWAEWKDEYDQWKSEEPEKVVPSGESTRVYTDSEVYDAIRQIDCFNYTMYGYYTHPIPQRCYMHVLVALIGPGNHTTSDNQQYSTSLLPGYGVAGGWSWNTCSEYENAILERTTTRNGRTVTLRELLMEDPVSTEACDGTTSTRAENQEVPCRGDGSDAAQYNTATGGNCYQKAVDLLWELHNNFEAGNDYGGDASQEELEKFWYFIEYDLGEWHEEPAGDEDNTEWEAWKEREPAEPDKYITQTETYISDIIVNDQHKGQWYTNLWHILNGSDTANLVEYKQLKKKDVEDPTLYGFKVPEKDKTVMETTYEVLDDELSTSPSWLQFALEHGVVSMEQAKYFDPSEDSGKAGLLYSDAITWKNIIYTNAADIVSQDDDDAVVKAEVEYKKTMKKIKSEDKKFDQDLRKLDSEHTALQAEYDSIKETISKNTDRSFKAFS